jgi:prophage tail gpP-like protein
LEVSNDASQRFSTYRVLAQQAGTDDTYGTAAAHITATAEDSGVKRRRALVVVDEDQVDIAGCQRRGQWERNIRAARALTVNVRVQGWTHAGGLWQPNLLVQLTTPTAHLDRQLLVRDVDLVVDERGTYTELVLTPPEAYTLQPPPPAKESPRRKGHKRGGAQDVFS